LVKVRQGSLEEAVATVTEVFSDYITEADNPYQTGGFGFKSKFRYKGSQF